MTPSSDRYIAAIGMFDGVHRGHRYLLEVLEAEKKRRGLRSLVITFSNHPLSVVSPERQPSLMMSAEEKRKELTNAGADRVLMLTFDASLRSLSGETFLGRLKNEYGVDVLVVGFDNHFGADRLSAVSASEIAGRTGVEIVCVDAFMIDDATPSSTLLRECVLNGRVEQAARVAGRPYSVCGEVVAGRKVGRTIGFPTANVASDGIVLPSDGVYAVDVVLPDGRIMRGMANIGRRPTFNDGNGRTLEVNIFGFKGDLYGSRLEVRFLRRLRDEQIFDTPEALAEALAGDRKAAESI